MNRRLSGLVFIGFAVGAAGAFGTALSCTDSTPAKLDPAAGGAGGAGGAGSGTSSGTMDDGGLPPDGFTSCPITCSNDLKQVVDCYGVPQETCADTVACLNGKCDATKTPCEVANESKSSLGCDYWAVKTALLDSTSGACFAAYVTNTWAQPIHLGVEYKGQALDPGTFAYIPQGQGANINYLKYDPAVGLMPGEVAILFLARNKNGFIPNCPKPAAIDLEAGVTNTGLGDAFHITTDWPAVAYQILPYGGGITAFTSATLLLPSSAWGDNYIAVNAYKNATNVPEASPFLDIVAQEDGTEVTILPVKPIVGGNGVMASGANQPAKYTLNRGQFLQIEQTDELTGSPIQSTKPVALFGGSSCLYMPAGGPSCDSAHQQILPVKAMGSQYAGVAYRPRGDVANKEMDVPWRIVGVVDGTPLFWNPESAAPSGAPSIINRGDIFEFNSPGGFIVESKDAEKPFHLSVYMTSGFPYNDEGDPEWISVVPTEQFLNKYTFFADPTYPETNLVVVRAKSKIKTENFKPVGLECLGSDIPENQWMDIGMNSGYQYTRIDLVTGNFQNVGNCSTGRQVMSSDLPFGVTVWGWGTKAVNASTLVSYGYPAGAGVRVINQVEVPPIPQ